MQLGLSFSSFLEVVWDWDDTWALWLQLISIIMSKHGNYVSHDQSLVAKCLSRLGMPGHVHICSTEGLPFQGNTATQPNLCGVEWASVQPTIASVLLASNLHPLTTKLHVRTVKQPSRQCWVFQTSANKWRTSPRNCSPELSVSPWAGYASPGKYLSRVEDLINHLSQ